MRPTEKATIWEKKSQNFEFFIENTSIFVLNNLLGPQFNAAPVPNREHPMSDEQSTTSDADKELEREIRADRKFSLAEAIGRLAGPGMMKGISPVPLKQQAEAQLEEYIRQNLTDGEGVLKEVLIRCMKQSDILLNNFEQPLAALANGIRRILDSEYLLQELVRETDAEWGRVFGERPFFEMHGRPPHPDDPYTLEGVRANLQKLLELPRP